MRLFVVFVGTVDVVIAAVILFWLLFLLRLFGLVIFVVVATVGLIVVVLAVVVVFLFSLLLGTRKVIMKEKRMGIDKEERRMYILRVKRRGRNGGKMKRWKDCNSIRNRTRRG